VDRAIIASAPVMDPPPGWLDDPNRPPVVIAIPNWNRSDLLRDCVESILQLTTYARYRVCVFDQGSTDSSCERLREWGDRVDAILSPENVGFILANNAIIDRYARWDVLLLNNDTQIVDPRWLETLVTTAYSAADIGLVGPKLLYPSGRLQEAGSQLFRNGSARAYGKFEDPADTAFNIRRDVDYCSAACVYVKRAVLRTTGAFDESYAPCYYEDADLALKARAAGYRTVYEPTAAVIHREYGTSGRTSAVELMVRNQAIFFDRWRHLLADHPSSLWQLEGEDRRAQALVIGNVALAESAPGRAARVRQIIEAISGSYRTAYADLGSAAAADQLRIQDAWNVTVFHPGFARAVGSDALDLGAIVAHNDFRWIVFDGPESAASCLAVVRQYGPGILAAIDAAADPACEDENYAAVDALLAASQGQRTILERRFPHTAVRVFLSAPPGSDRHTRGPWPRLRRALVGAPGQTTVDIAIILKELEEELDAARLKSEPSVLPGRRDEVGF
jgi:GT2 family glycosyltransferase